MVSGQDVQSKIDAAIVLLEKTTSSGTQMISKHGPDWTKWPTTSFWYQGLYSLSQARQEAGVLVAPELKAAFTFNQ